LQRDLAYLSRLWQVVARRIKKIKTPAEIYQESDMIIRTIRDTLKRQACETVRAGSQSRNSECSCVEPAACYATSWHYVFRFGDLRSRWPSK
jgi:hypothetical protein